MVQSISTVGSTITNGSTGVQYTVAFNEGVTGVAASDFTLTTSGTSGSIASVTGSGTTYTVTVNNVSGNGTLGLNLVDNNSIVDQYNNPLGGPLLGDGNFTGPLYTIDNTAPTISIGIPSATITNSGPISYTVTYADANFNTSTLAASNVTLNETGTASGTIAVSGTGLTRTVTISSITGDGSLGISIGAGTASDLAGNLAPAAGASATFTVDNTAPTISIGTPSATITNSGPITYTVTYADAHFGSSSLVAADITLDPTGDASGTVNVAGSGQSYTVTISNITGDGSLGISIAAGTAIDLAGNTALAAGSSGTFTVDNIAPTVTIGSPSAAYANSSDTVTYTVTYADANFGSSSLVAGDITLDPTGDASGTVNVAGSGQSYTVSISNMTGDGSLGISIAAGTAIDLAGNTALAAGPSGTFTVDNIAPTITIGSPSAAYANSSDTITYTVTYADAHFGSSSLVAGDITLDPTENASGTVNVSGSGQTYTVTISNMTGDGTLGISIAAGTAIDLAGNTALAAGPSGTFTVDNIAPTITIGSPSAAYANSSATITYTVTYADAHFGSSSLVAGDITLDPTENASGTVNVSGSGQTYTVTISNMTGDGTLGISIAAGTATDLAGNTAPASGSSATFTVDTIAPTISIGSPSAAYANSSATITYTVTYADAHFGSSSLVAGDITLDPTENASGTVNVSGSGQTYTVTISNMTGDGTLGISIAAGTATDLAGNTAPASGSSATFTVDTIAPTISIGSPSAAYANSSDTITYTVTYANANFGSSSLVAGDITLDPTENASGTVNVSGSGQTYTVTISNMTGDGTLGISIAAGTATDLAGNTALASGSSANLHRGHHRADDFDRQPLGSLCQLERYHHLHGDIRRCEFRIQLAGRRRHYPGSYRKRQRHGQRLRLGPDLHGDHQQHDGRWYPGDFDRGGHGHRLGGEHGPGLRAQRDVHGRQHHGGDGGQCHAHHRHRHDDRSFGAGGGSLG